MFLLRGWLIIAHNGQLFLPASEVWEVYGVPVDGPKYDHRILANYLATRDAPQENDHVSKHRHGPLEPECQLPNLGT